MTRKGVGGVKVGLSLKSQREARLASLTKLEHPMARTARGLGAVFLAMALVACGGGGGAGVTTDPATTGTVRFDSIRSLETGLTYDVHVWTPAGVPQAKTTYPVVYAMDCEYRLSTLIQVLRQSATKVILVNVCAMGSDRRWVDFTMPGAAAYYRFLVRELIPWVDAAYPTDPAQRTLSGHSLSGEFALYALYLEDPANRYFKSIISAECSCWYDAGKHFSPQLEPPQAMEQAMYQTSRSLPINLIMAGDTYGNQRYVSDVYALITSRNYPSLRSVQPVYNLGHGAMDGPSFKEALEFIFGPH